MPSRAVHADLGGEATHWPRHHTGASTKGSTNKMFMSFNVFFFSLPLLRHSPWDTRGSSSFPCHFHTLVDFYSFTDLDSLTDETSDFLVKVDRLESHLDPAGLSRHPGVCPLVWPATRERKEEEEVKDKLPPIQRVRGRGVKCCVMFIDSRKAVRVNNDKKCEACKEVWEEG